MTLRTIVARTFADISQINAVRAAVFLNEQKCPYLEEFDGNDFSGSQLLGQVGDEPAASLRIRYFAGFAKIERLAVLPRYRGLGVGKAIAKSGIELCLRKGYSLFYLHAQERLVGFWRAFGFEPVETNGALVFSDHSYLAMKARLSRSGARLSLRSAPAILNRPEGEWDEPGILDRSAARPPTNPHM
jgi:predicted GNAT family N-acyltransferase